MAKKRKARAAKAKAPKVVKIGKYACIICGRTAEGPVYCCGPLSRLHLPKKMGKR